MARKGITFDQVSNAAAALKARGQEPTIAAVRVELGNEGSFSTISQHLAKWRSEAAAQQETRSLPPEAEDSMMQAMMKVWNCATKIHAEELEALRQGFEDEKKRLQGELASALEEVARLEGLTLDFDQQAQEQQARAQKSEKENNRLTAELSVSRMMYQELIKTLRPQEQAEHLDADTRAARPAKTKGGLENKQA